MLKDIAAIAQAETGEEDNEDEEAAEEDFFALVEYLRFAILNVYMDRHSDDRDVSPDSGVNRPLH